ncbi:hypothetical protein GCM10009798_43250 [Nocardioides panacihumi]|uniref:Uncharacterized protein n=1 Tax=Nocardioides panacihumi TaxID=400774 RepID=A0ABP5DET5_9ACTN
MTVHVPCRCRTVIRVRWSRFLVVSASMTETPGGAAGPAELTRDDSGWTTLRTDQPGDYLVRGRVWGRADA